MRINMESIQFFEQDELVHLWKMLWNWYAIVDTLSMLFILSFMFIGHNAESTRHQIEGRKNWCCCMAQVLPYTTYLCSFWKKNKIIQLHVFGIIDKTWNVVEQDSHSLIVDRPDHNFLEYFTFLFNEHRMRMRTMSQISRHSRYAK